MHMDRCGISVYRQKQARKEVRKAMGVREMTIEHTRVYMCVCEREGERDREGERELGSVQPFQIQTIYGCILYLVALSINYYFLAQFLPTLLGFSQCFYKSRNAFIIPSLCNFFK